MGKTINIIGDIDNTGTLYEQVIEKSYPSELWDTILIDTKILRFGIIKIINEYVANQHTIVIKEFSDVPPMSYDDPSKYDIQFPEISTDLIIVKKAFSLPIINVEASKIPAKYPLVLEALNHELVSKASWDELLDDVWLYYGGAESARVQRIVIEDAVSVLKFWEDISFQNRKDMIKAYNASHGISTYNKSTFWQEPLDIISKKYWEKFSFVLTINDYDLYDESKSAYLDLIAEKYFNNGYFDEIVIKMNYFYWHDNFQKIIDWSAKNLKSALVSYRFDTLFSDGTKNRYFDVDEASKYGDVQRINTIAEELEMYDTRLPIFLKQILTNPQTYGFELSGGYLGNEGEVPNLELQLGTQDFETFKNIICKILSLSPFIHRNDNYVKVFRDPLKKVFICVKR